MGREIRKIPGNWQHPRGMRSYGREDYLPLHNRSYEHEAKEFMEMAKEKGLEEAVDYYGEAPKRDEYFPDWPESERTHFAVYETVSEGTPVTPAFATKEELATYLAENGDFWDQKRGHGGWGIEAARRFVQAEWAPSMMILDGTIHEPRNMPEQP